MKINVSGDMNAIPERNVNTIDPKDQEKWEIEWDINNLRNEIRKDMQDYKLFTSVEDYEDIHRDYVKRAWFMEYLNKQIDGNVSKLKELVEQENQ
jgi:hypothetical protein